MFGKKSNQEDIQNSRNHIANGTSLRGTIEASGGLRIDGKVEGDVIAIGKLVIGEKGRIEGTINCKDAEVEGTVNGNISASGLLYFKATARVIGNIDANQMKIDPGARHNGHMNIKVEAEAAPELNGKQKSKAGSKAQKVA